MFCIDEAGFYVGDHPRKGRSKRGHKLAIGTGKSLRKAKFTLILVIGINGIVGYKIQDKNCKIDSFVDFVNDLDLPKGSVLLMDNLKAHHSNEVQYAGINKGFRFLFTPPYSPRCNPIEKIFGAFKPVYRKLCVEETIPKKKDDYRNIFTNILEINTNTSFLTTYQNTLSFINETIQNIDSDPKFKFIGYDVKSFVTRIEVELIPKKNRLARSVVP